jgi:ATP-dependent Lhr-like helicase
MNNEGVREGQTFTKEWLNKKGWHAHEFQKEAWKSYDQGHHRLIHLSTGFGKTYAAILRALDHLAFEKQNKQEENKNKSIRILYLSPLRALGNDLKNNIEAPLKEMNSSIRVATRTGDTTQSQRARIKDRPPEVLITTPESLNLMLTSESIRESFEALDLIVVDEWHELMASKRGVQVQLALQHLLGLAPNCKITGLSATLGNPEMAAQVLVGPGQPVNVITGPVKREFDIECLKPDAIDSFPWAGHLGLSMVEKVSKMMNPNSSTLYFTNTRSQAERWYSELKKNLEERDEGHLIGLHHSSIERDQRELIEKGLKVGTLPYVVCTSSLDLGVDFPKVERVFQIGSAKSISRFLQRAGRSQHRPGGIPTITFVPTHALELLEFMAVQRAMNKGHQEKIEAPLNSFDVLVQHLQTLALAQGLDPDEAYQEITCTYTFQDLTQEEFQRALDFLVTGGCLKSYDNYQKLKEFKGRFYLSNKEMIRTHRINMGTITSDPVITVQYVRGAKLGTVEENFVSKLKKGAIFNFAGKVLKYVMLKDLKLYVKKASANEVVTPVWQGGKLPLSDLLTHELRDLLEDLSHERYHHDLLSLLGPILSSQKRHSVLPKSDELLIETCETREGHHTFIFPFAGRLVHEGLAALMSMRLSQIHKETFSFSVNEYGLEILGPSGLTLTESDLRQALKCEDLILDMEKSLDKSGLAKRQFKEIAQISGLVPQNQIGRRRTLKNLQSSTSLLFDVFERFEVSNLLYQQSLAEVKIYQFQEKRMKETLKRLESGHLVYRLLPHPSPFGFPLVIERMSATVSGNSLKERIEKLKKAYQA